MVQVVRTLTQAEFDAFAALSGDANPIHTDPGFAARTAFGRTVAHGAMLTAILRALAAPLIGARRVRAQTVMFPAPTFAGEPVVFSAETAGDSQLLLCSMRQADGVETCRILLELA